MSYLNFTPENLKSVLGGSKTETRRLVHDGDIFSPIEPSERGSAIPIADISYANGRIRYAVGRGYSITPGRGKCAVGRVVIESMCVEFLDQITQESVDAERYGRTPAEYIERFQQLYKQGPDYNPLVIAIRFKLQEINARGGTLLLESGV